MPAEPNDPPLVDPESSTSPVDAPGPNVEAAASSAEAATEVLDWSAIPQKTTEVKPTVGADYDSRPVEDQARRYIAYTLIGLLIGLILAILLLIASGIVKVAEIKEFSVILGPVVTLVSAATGFYYGTKSK